MGQIENGEGEICMKGRGTFVGYLKNKNETLKTIDCEGYVHSGDTGRLDEKGYLHISGRIKEIIKTSGGEIVAPIYLEEKFLNICKVCSYILVVGDMRKYISALIFLKANEKGELEGDAIEHMKTHGSECRTV